MILFQLHSTWLKSKMPTLSTITVQNVLDYCRAHIALKQLLGIGGVSNEPGMSIANDVLQFLLAKPFAWKFNRKIAPFFVTQPFIQDYYFAGACAFILNPVVASGGVSSIGGGGVGIDLAAKPAITQSGTTVTVNCLQRHNFTVGQTAYLNNVVDQSGNLVAALNATLTIDTNALTATWSNGFVITAVTGTSFQFTAPGGQPNCGAQGITDFGWLESAALTDYNNTAVPQPTGPIEAVERITPTNMTGEPKRVAVLQDLGTGVLVFRVDPCAPSYSMAVTCAYQGRAPRLRTPSDLWAPWPDNLSFVLRAGAKAYAYDLADKPMAEKVRKMQEFYAAAQSAKEFSDAEDDNLGFAPSVGIMRG